MDCEVSWEELAALAAGELHADRARELERHLSACATCQGRLKALKGVDAALPTLARMEPSAAALLAARRALSELVRGPRAPEIMTLEEVAQFLRVTVDDLTEVAAELPAFEIAGRIRVRRSRLIEWIEQRERARARSTIESEVAGILAGLI